MTSNKIFLSLFLTLWFLMTAFALHSTWTSKPTILEKPVTQQETESPQPERRCVWGKNDDGSCVDLDPCVYSDAKCKPETLIEARKQDLEQRIRDAATFFHIDPDVAVAIAQCESQLDPYASNPHSSAKGLFQFTDGTWAYIKAVGHQFDADESIKQFMIWYQIHPNWWVCE